MLTAIILDTGVLSNAAVPFARQGKEPTLSQRCRNWIADRERNGELLLVPAVCYFEALRELERRGATGKIKRLREFVFRVPGRLIPITTAHLESAARIWAEARNMGIPSASNLALDADVIICAQALSLGIAASDYVVATTNVRHLGRFVPAQEWTNILA